MTSPTDEMLMAYADGALPPEEAAAIAKLAAADSALRERIEMYRASRRLAADALKPLAQEPVPQALEDAVRAMIAASETARSENEPENVVAFRPKPRAEPAPRHWSMRIAASVAVLAAAIGGYALGFNSSPGTASSQVAVGAPLPGAIAGILSSQPSGSETMIDGARVKIASSVKAQDGTLCREFEIDRLAEKQTSLGVACRAGEGWRLDIAVAAPADQSGYAPASSMSVLDSYFEAIGASEALDADQEKNALR